MLYLMKLQEVENNSAEIIWQIYSNSTKFLQWYGLIHIYYA